MRKSKYTTAIARRGALALALASLSAVVLVMGGSSGASAASGGGSGVASASEIATQKAYITSLAKNYAFVAPPSFDASKAKGKTVWYIGDDSTGAAEFWYQGALDGLQAAGVNVKFYEVGNPATESATQEGFQLAIAAKASAIAFGEPGGATEYAAQIAEAKAAGIPVVSINDSAPGAQPKVPGLFVDSSFNFAEVGTIEAKWIVAESGGKPIDVYSWYLGGNFPSITGTTAEKAELAKLVPGAKIDVAELPLTATSTDTANAVQTALERDPSINFVVPPFDSQIQEALPGIAAAGRASSVQTLGYNGIEPMMQGLKNNTVPHITNDLSSSNEQLGWAQADNVLRALTGHPPVENVDIGIKLWTHANVQKINVTEENANSWYGLNLKADYDKVWGIS